MQKPCQDLTVAKQLKTQDSFTEDNTPRTPVSLQTDIFKLRAVIRSQEDSVTALKHTANQVLIGFIRTQKCITTAVKMDEKHRTKTQKRTPQ